MKIAIVYGNDGSDVRIAKTCGTLVRLGHEVHFVGWDRRPDVEKDSDLPGVTRHVVTHAAPVLGSTVSGQWAFTRHAVSALLRLRPDVVVAVNEDNVLRVGWLKGLAFRKLVCDVFDSHLDRTTHRGWVLKTAGWSAANAARIWSDRLIATDDVRHETFGRFRKKTIVVGNYPCDPGPELARLLPSGPPTLFVSGTLSLTRGIKETLEAAQQVPDFRIVAAGWPGDEYARDVFLKDSRVEFLGHLTPRQSLQHAAASDVLLAMYAPTSRNQILASPNKIYDAISVGRRVIINSEARVSKWVTEHDMGLACPYYDVDQLANCFRQLAALRSSLGEYASRARALFESGYSWEAMETRLDALYGSFDSSSNSKQMESKPPLDNGPEPSATPALTGVSADAAHSSHRAA